MVLSGYHPISCSSAPLTAKLLKISGLHYLPPVPPLPFSLEPTVIGLCPQHATKTALVEVPVTPLLPSTLAISQSSSPDLLAALDLADHSLLLRALSPLGLWDGPLYFALSLSFLLRPH